MTTSKLPFALGAIALVLSACASQPQNASPRIGKAIGKMKQLTRTGPIICKDSMSGDTPLPLFSVCEGIH